MELRHLRYFVAVAEELHFGRAAGRLHMAQPPLSQQIKALETELGLKLFERTKRRVELTDPGRLFLDEARATLARARRAEEVVRQAAKGMRGRLAVAFVTSASYSILPEVIRMFRADHPDVELTLQELNPAEQLAAIRKRDVDVGLLRLPVPNTSLALEPVLKEPLVAALPRDHRLADSKFLRLKALAGEPFILFPRHHGPGIFDVIMKACERAGFSPRMGQEPNDMQSILAYVAGGLGVSLVPASLAGFHAPSVSYLPLQPKPPCVELALAYDRERTPILLDSFRKTCREAALAHGTCSR
jgi:DNA-binding transcriptional LysR family regulator